MNGCVCVHLSLKMVRLRFTAALLFVSLHFWPWVKVAKVTKMPKSSLGSDLHRVRTKMFLNDSSIAFWRFGFLVYSPPVWPWIFGQFLQASFGDWAAKSVSLSWLLVTVCVFCQLKTASNCTQTYHLGGKKLFFRGATAHPPPPPTPPTLDTYGALPPPYWNLKYATGWRSSSRTR